VTAAGTQADDSKQKNGSRRCFKKRTGETVIGVRRDSEIRLLPRGREVCGNKPQDGKYSLIRSEIVKTACFVSTFSRRSPAALISIFTKKSGYSPKSSAFHTTLPLRPTQAQLREVELHLPGFDF